MALTEAQRMMLMNRLAVKYRVDQQQLVALTMNQLRELWRVLESARNAEQWVAAATNGLDAIVSKQQNNAVALSALLFFQSGEIYKNSGAAPSAFRATTGDKAEFLTNSKPQILGYAAREARYHLTQAAGGNITRVQALKQLEGVAQEAIANTSREYITQQALASAHVEATEEAIPLAQRYAPKTKETAVEALGYRQQDALPAGRILDVEDETDWVDEATDEFSDELSWLDEPEFTEHELLTGYKEGHTPDDLLTETKLKKYKAETAKPSPVSTDVRAGGCEYCKIVGIGKGPHKWHKHCNCVNLPQWKNFKKGKPPWEDEAEALYYKARAVAEDQLTDKNSYVTMDDIMREIRIMEYAEKNKQRIARGEAPRKPYRRKPPKTLREKQDTAMRNAARVDRERAMGRW